MMEEHKDHGSGEKKVGGTCTNCCASPLHWSCCVKPLISLLFWLAGILFLVFAWIAKDQVYLNWGAQWWYWNALVFGVLGLHGSGKKMGSCRGGCSMCGGKKCGCMPSCTCSAGACACK